MEIPTGTDSVPQGSPAKATTVGICALLSFLALGLVLARALAELREETLPLSTSWLIYLSSMLPPYAAIIWLLGMKRRKAEWTKSWSGTL